MKTARADRVILAIAFGLAVMAVLLMSSLPGDFLQVNPVYQGF